MKNKYLTGKDLLANNDYRLEKNIEKIFASPILLSQLKIIFKNYYLDDGQDLMEQLIDFLYQE